MAEQGVDILPRVASRGTLGAVDERWEAVYADRLYTLSDEGVVIDVARTFAKLGPVQMNLTELQAAVDQLTVDVSGKADKSHGTHVPTPLTNQPLKFLRSDNTWATMSTELIDAPTKTGSGASGTWGIDISGNAATADQATRDGAGQVITSTYVKQVVYTSDGHLKVVRGDGTSYEVLRTITPQGIGAPTLTGTGASGTWGISISGNAATATKATTADKANALQATAAQNRLARVVGLDGTTPITDSAVYLTTTPGQLHATSFDGTSATLSGALTAASGDYAGTVTADKFVARGAVEASTVTADIVTAGKFIGSFDGTVTNAVQAAKATGLELINDNARKLMVVGQQGDQAYYDTNVYITTTEGQLHVTSLEASTVTAATFTGTLNGRAAQATNADYAASVKVTNDSSRQAALLAHVNGVIYSDPNVYLTIYNGQLQCTSVVTTNVETGTLAASSDMTGTNLTLKATAPTISFKWNNGNAVTHTLRPTSASLLTCSTEFTATKCYNAVWNDYAEFFEQGEPGVRPGDIIALADGGEERYVRATRDAKVVVGVCSDEYGHAVGGLPAEPGKSVAETNDGRFVAVALAGRVWVNVRGRVDVGDRVVPTDEPGVGRASVDPNIVAVGWAVTAKPDEGLGRVRVVVCLGA